MKIVGFSNGIAYKCIVIAGFEQRQMKCHDSRELGLGGSDRGLCLRSKKPTSSADILTHSPKTAVSCLT
jgi:hypothetical protein